jgi:hypothetical protein
MIRLALFIAFLISIQRVTAAPLEAAPPIALNREPTALLLFRTINRGEFVSFDQIPQNLPAPFWLLSTDNKQVLYQTQLEVWSPQVAPEDASGGLRSLVGATPQEWAVQITPAPAWPDLIAEPKVEAPIETPETEEIKADAPADNPQNAAEITVPEIMTAQVYTGCGETLREDEPRITRMASAVLERWRVLGRLPVDWGGVGSLGQAQNSWSAAELAADKTVPRAAGEYRLITSFVPDLKFNIGTEQQFMTPVRLSVGPLPLDWSKPLHLNWQPVEGVRGYRVRAVGRRFKSTDPQSVIVVWSATPLSRLQSEVPIIDSETALKRGEILPADATSCVIPAGIFKDVDQITFFLEAIGQARTFVAPKSDKNAPPGTFGGTTLRVATVSEAIVTLETGQVQD